MKTAQNFFNNRKPNSTQTQNRTILRGYSGHIYLSRVALAPNGSTQEITTISRTHSLTPLGPQLHTQRHTSDNPSPGLRYLTVILSVHFNVRVAARPQPGFKVPGRYFICAFQRAGSSSTRRITWRGQLIIDGG